MKRHNSDKSEISKSNLKAASKNYKRTVSKHYANYKRKIRQKLNNLRTKNPKEYWKILNKNNQSSSNNNLNLNIFYEFFKNINEIDDTDERLQEPNFDVFPNSTYNFEINSPIKESEIVYIVNNLKNDKSCAQDGIINEYLKSTLHLMLPIYTKLFNLVFDTGIIPEEWLVGVIKPVYKNKGDKADPDNYRAITLVSCFGKVFTGIINKRLNDYAEKVDLITKVQAGFRKSYSTSDNIFILHCLIELLFADKKKLFCTFIDFRKAFDSVWRGGLWIKLQKYLINGKCFDIIKNMYNSIKSCVMIGEQKSEYFMCNVGVRQGENLSPFLFSLFLNDLEEFFVQENVKGLSSISSKCNDQLRLYFKIFLLLYADDTLIFAEDITSMQEALDNFAFYCDHWKLDVNIKKTKIMVFSRGRAKHSSVLKYKDTPLEFVDHYGYLGIIFSKNGKFFKARKKLVEQASRALFGVYKKITNLNLSVKCQLNLFDKMIVPILTYGSEVWGFENISILENIHLKFCKKVLKLRKSTPNCMVYGELGRFPLNIIICKRMISFWCRIVNEPDKFSYIFYNLMFKMFQDGKKVPWIEKIKSIFDSLGFSNIWDTQGQFLSNQWIIKAVERKLEDQFIQKWDQDIFNSPKTVSYRIFKTEFCLENYLNILPNTQRLILTKFRTGNHRLPIETGRWTNVSRNERLCTKCCDGKIGDEFHLLFECCKFRHLRIKYIDVSYWKNANTYKFSALFKSKNRKKLLNLIKFLKEAQLEY